MKLKKWLKYVDPIVNVKIFGSNHDEPIFEGAAFDIPWQLVEHKIGRANKDFTEEPIYICKPVNQKLPLIVINIL